MMAKLGTGRISSEDKTCSSRILVPNLVRFLYFAKSLRGSKRGRFSIILMLVIIIFYARQILRFLTQAGAAVALRAAAAFRAAAGFKAVKALRALGSFRSAFRACKQGCPAL